MTIPTLIFQFKIRLTVFQFLYNSYINSICRLYMFIYIQRHSSCSCRVWDCCVDPTIGIKGQGGACWAKDGHGVLGVGVNGFGWMWRA